MLTRLVTTTLLLSAAVSAESQERCVSPRLAPAGSERERYLRLAQVVGATGAQPWTVRAFTPRQLAELEPSDSALPWGSRDRGSRTARCAWGFAFAIVTPRAQIMENSSFPFGGNDGAIWAGRGITRALDGGATASNGTLTITFVPLAFVADNDPFAIKPNGRTGEEQFADWRNPTQIDLPQRFGTRRYAEFDMGQSEIRVDMGGVALGISTANEYWGPATDHPVILGNNAAGFAHLFAGTSKPLRIWKLGNVHGRLLWGKLQQSPYSPVADSAGDRLASGVAFVFQPKAAPFLEIGGSRFFHVLQDHFKLSVGELLRPIGAMPNVETGTSGLDNQLVSLFTRLVLPKDSTEVAGEYGHEDHIGNFRQWMQFLDHDAAYLIGGRKAWRRGTSVMSLRGEILNTRVTHLAMSSNQTSWYEHSAIRQGHTNKGQALGSFAAYGGGGSILALDRYDERGRVTVSWERVQLGDSRDVAPDLFKSDVAHVWRVNTLRFGRHFDVEAGVAAIYEINRQLLRDALGLQATLSLTAVQRRLGSDQRSISR